VLDESPGIYVTSLTFGGLFGIYGGLVSEEFVILIAGLIRDLFG